MTRRMYRMLFAGVLVGLSLTGIACGGSNKDEPSNAPVGKAPEGSPGPVQAGGPMSDTGKMTDQGTAVPRK